MRPSSFGFPFGRGIATVSEEEEEEEEEESRCRSPKSSNVSHADDFEVDADGEGNATHDSIDARFFLFYRWCLSSRRRRAFVTSMMIATSFKEAVRCRVASKKRLWHILFLFYSKKGQKIKSVQWEKRSKKSKIGLHSLTKKKKKGSHTDDRHEQRGAFSLFLSFFLSLSFSLSSKN